MKHINIKEVSNGFIIYENGQNTFVASNLAGALEIAKNILTIVPADKELAKPTPVADAVTKDDVEADLKTIAAAGKPENDGEEEATKKAEKAAKAKARKEAKEAKEAKKAAEVVVEVVVGADKEDTALLMPVSLPYSPQAPDQVVWVKQLQESIKEQTCSGLDVSVCLRLHAAIHGLAVTKELISKMGYKKPSDVPEEKAPAFVALFFANIIADGIDSDLEAEDF